MPALPVGRKAPEISLPLVNGQSFSLSQALARGPVVVAFFKISCPVCQLALPYLERMYRAYRNGKATLLGISQNTKQDTQAFLKEYGITFPVALDPAGAYPASNAYGLTNVPTIFFVESDGRISVSSVGWDRKDVDAINDRIAGIEQKDRKDIFAGADVPEFKPG